MKKIKKPLSLMLSLLMVLSMCSGFLVTSFAEEYGTVLKGDVDGDGVVTPADARLALRCAAALDALSDEQKAVANVNDDTRITAVDAQLLLRYTVRLSELENAAPAMTWKDRSGSGSESAPVLHVDATDAAVGEEMTVTVSATNMVGTETGALSFTFDPEYLEFVDIDFTGDGFMGTAGLWSDFDNCVGLGFISAKAAEEDGNLCIITFRVLKAGNTSVDTQVIYWSGTEAPESIEQFYIGPLSFSICDGEATVADCDTIANGELVIPNTYQGYPVTGIGDDAFADCYMLTSISMPDGISIIGDRAFDHCTALTNVNIPESVTSIGYNAFYYCSSLTSITIPNRITKIEDGVFQGCSSLTNIKIPDSVTKIGDGVFEGCSSLTNITIPESVTSIGYEAFYDCSSLSNIIIPDSVTFIGAYAFYGCSSLTNIIIPNGVTSIDYGTFYDCSSLKNIIIPDSVTSIGGEAFYNTGYYNDESNWENDVLYIGNHLIRAKETINGSYTVKEGTKCIADSAFNACGSLASVNIPESVTSIGVRAFYRCISLASIDIPDSVTEINCEAFYDCSNLTSIAIPDSVTSIRDSLFYGCSNLTTIALSGNIENIGTFAFLDTAYYNDESNWEDTVLYLDNYLVEAKTTIDEEYEIKTGTKLIADRAFERCEKLTDITIPDSMISIGYYAFAYCSGLTNITIPDGVVHIGVCAFDHCSSLTSIIIPGSVTRIDDDAFSDCCSLKNVTISDGVTDIGGFSFYDCTNLTNVTIPDSVTKIGYSAFANCSSLTSITIPDSVTSIDAHAIGYFFDDSAWQYKTIDGFIIYGTPGTAAETYADENGITFVPVGEEPPTEEPTTSTPVTEPSTDAPTTEPSTEAPEATTEPTTKAPVTEPTTKAPVTTTEPTTEAPATTAPATTTEPTTQTSSELIIKDADSIAVVEDEKLASIGAVDNKGLTVEAIKAKLGNESVAIASKDGEALADDALVGTGCAIQVLDKDGKVLSEYTVLVPMDVNGDAAITAQDARAALRAAAQLEKPEGVYRTAADTDGDTKLTASDARRILRKAAHLE